MTELESAQKIQLDYAEKTVHTVLGFLGVHYTVNVQESADGIWIALYTQEPSLLIGEGGQNLAAINHLIYRIVDKNFPEGCVKFLIDVNDYKKKVIETIKDEARIHAQRVRYFKQNITMRHMNAYERRIVHMVLQEYPDIATESTGEGIERRVVIKPFDMV
jgi:spoIIIJ-associated protein